MRREPKSAALSDDERRILAVMEADLERGDPGFAAVFLRRMGHGAGQRTAVPMTAIVTGGGLMVVTFTVSLVLATVGAVLMALGAAAGAPRAEVAARRMAAFLGWWVDPNDPPRLSGFPDHPL